MNTTLRAQPTDGGVLRENGAGNDLAQRTPVRLSTILEKAKEEYKEAEAWFIRWYSEARAQGRITENDEDD